VVEVVTSATFDRWLRKLNDRRPQPASWSGSTRLAAGNPGDVQPVGHGVSELRIDYGPGYRLYYLRSGTQLVVLLSGGDKSTQEADIRAAHDIARSWHRTQGEHP
jgi:putative addiction module killer protein